MKTLKNNPKSGRLHRVQWQEKKPSPENCIFIDDAIKVAGSAANLAKLLGITRSAVYQWRPPYRFDPYMPEESARRLLSENPEIAKEIRRLK